MFLFLFLWIRLSGCERLVPRSVCRIFSYTSQIKDSANRSRNKPPSTDPWDTEGLTSNGTRHLATLICEFGMGRCLFKEPRSGSLAHIVFLLIVLFSFLTIRSTGLPQIRKESYTLGIGIRWKNPSGLRD